MDPIAMFTTTSLLLSTFFAANVICGSKRRIFYQQPGRHHADTDALLVTQVAFFLQPSCSPCAIEEITEIADKSTRNTIDEEDILNNQLSLPPEGGSLLEKWIQWREVALIVLVSQKQPLALRMRALVRQKQPPVLRIYVW
jgi:hypothetical protein